MAEQDIRILYMEDVPFDMELALSELLREKILFTAVRVECREDFIYQFNVFNPDVIITDYNLPEINGIEVIHLVNKLDPLMPVIIVTGAIDEETAVECIKAGAVDYLLKEKLKRLPFAVVEALRIKEFRQQQVKADAALARSLARFKEISEIAGEFIWEIDVKGVFTYANPMSLQTIGYVPDELTGKMNFGDLVHHVEGMPGAGINEASFQEFFSVQDRVFKSIHKKGHEIILQVVGIPVKGEGDEITGYQGLIRDITERVRKEEDLRGTNVKLEKKVKARTFEIERLSRLYQEVFRNLGLAVITTDIEGTIESFNPEAERLLGFSAEDVVRKFALQVLSGDKEWVENQEMRKIGLIPGKTKNPAFTYLLNPGSGQKSFLGEVNYVTSQGGIVPVLLVVNILEGESGDISGFIGVAVDITERKRSTELLKIREEMFRTMFSEHEAVMLLIDPSTGVIEEANKSAGRFYGYDFMGPQKKSIHDINIKARDVLKGEMQMASNQKLNYFLFQHKLASGEIRSVEVHSTPIAIPGKKLLFSIIHDITERTRAEEKLKRREAEMSAIVKSVPDLMYRLNRKGVILESYHPGDQFRYASREDVLEKKLSSFLPEDLVYKSMESIEEAFTSGTAAQLEFQLPLKDGEHYYECRLVAIDENEALAIVRDISARKAVELSLHWNESLLRLMASSSPLAFFVVDNRNDDILYFNHRFCEIWCITDVEERMRRSEMKNKDIIIECIPALMDADAFALSCMPLQDEENRIVVEDEIPFRDGRVIRRFTTQIRGENDEYFGRFYIFEDISERKKAEEELQLRESYLEAVINNHPGMFWLKDTNGKFVFINDRENQFRKNAGLKSSYEVVGRTDSEFMSAELAEKYQDEDRRVIETGEPLTIEEKIPDANGEEWYEKFKYPVFDSGGKVIGVSGYSINITDRKKTEVQLKLQQAAFESFSLAMMITDKDGVIQWLNPAFTELTGYPKDEIIGRKTSILKSGKQDVTFYEKMWARMLSGKVWSGELINKRKDGSLYNEEETITPVLDESGEISMFIAIKIDISHRKEMEEALRRSEKRWQFALEGSGDGVWDWNALTDEVFFSHQWRAMLGYSDDEIRNSLDEWSNRVHPDDLERCNEDLAAHFAGKTPVYINEHRILCKDGTYKWILDRGQVVEWDADHKPARVIGTHTDISSSKMLEEKLMNTIEKEKELSEMKTRFVATASHEFRTPLASILIISDTLLEYWKRLQENQIQERLEKIKEQTLHLSSVVNNVLQLSRIQQGKLGYDPQPCELVQLCRQSIESFNSDPVMLERIHFESETAPVNLLIDRILIMQAISNLISNALKYSSWNSTVKVNLKVTPHGIEIAVADSGIGIPAEEQKHLFDPFFRASNSRLIQGNGLGLTIVNESVRMHGGEITFTSESEIGTTFVIHLPSSLIIKQ